jgi:hypothetical protein
VTVSDGCRAAAATAATPANAVALLELLPVAGSPVAPMIAAGDVTVIAVDGAFAAAFA